MENVIKRRAESILKAMPMKGHREVYERAMLGFKTLCTKISIFSNFIFFMNFLKLFHTLGISENTLTGGQNLGGQ